MPRHPIEMHVATLRVPGSSQNRVTWQPGSARPARIGKYHRRSLLGVVVDVWDGNAWRRECARGSAPHRVDQSLPDGYRGVVCSNQDLPWREL